MVEAEAPSFKLEWEGKVAPNLNTSDKKIPDIKPFLLTSSYTETSPLKFGVEQDGEGEDSEHLSLHKSAVALAENHTSFFFNPAKNQYFAKCFSNTIPTMFYIDKGEEALLLQETCIFLTPSMMLHVKQLKTKTDQGENLSEIPIPSLFYYFDATVCPGALSTDPPPFLQIDYYKCMNFKQISDKLAFKPICSTKMKKKDSGKKLVFSQKAPAELKKNKAKLKLQNVDANNHCEIRYDEGDDLFYIKATEAPICISFKFPGVPASFDYPIKPGFKFNIANYIFSLKEDKKE